MRRSPVVFVAVLLLVLTSRAWPQEPTESPPPTAPPTAPPEQPPLEGGTGSALAEVIAFAELAKGDHVNLLLKTGQNFEGQVVAVEPTSIILDFTFSRQRIAGIITFPKANVAVVMRLPELTREQKALRLERRRQQALKARERWSMIASTDLKGKPQALSLTPEQKEEHRRAQEEEEVERSRALLREFPPEQGWGPQRLAQIRRRHFILGIPLTYPEWRFWQVFDQWSEAMTIVELYDRKRAQEQQMLLTMFPPKEGWSAAVKQQLERKRKSEEKLTELEARFLKDYDRWQEAVRTSQQKPQPTKEAPPEAPAAPTSTPLPSTS